MRETFDDRDRAGVYLKPMLRTKNGAPSGGALVTLERARGEDSLDELGAPAGRPKRRAVFTPPIFAGDALEGTTNPLFALRALREFVALCLAQRRDR